MAIKNKLFLHTEWCQILILICCVVFVYWHALFAGIPRADQIIYLHKVSKYKNIKEILQVSPSWNRVIANTEKKNILCQGDVTLYRPILYILLGGFYFLFGYNFILWQGANLVLHLLVSVGVYNLLNRGNLMETVFPFLFSLLFSVAFLSSELVLWNHLSGYILFCLLILITIRNTIKFTEAYRIDSAIFSLIAAFLAEFTYELGVVINILIGIFFLIKNMSNRIGNTEIQASKKKRINDAVFGIAFLIIALIYPLISVYDLHVHGIVVIPSTGELSVKNFFIASAFSIKQIFFWLIGWLFPVVFNVAVGSRAKISSVNFDLSLICMLNYLSVGLIAVSTISYLSRERKKKYVKDLKLQIALILPIVFLLLYSWTIAYGRTLWRGWDWVFRNNIYYNYIAYFSIAMSIAFISVFHRFAYSSKQLRYKKEVINKCCRIRSFIKKHNALMLKTGIILIVFLNGYSTYCFAKRFRYEYASPRQKLFDSVEQWQRSHKSSPNEFYKLTFCPYAESSDWYKQFCKGTNCENPSFIDALLPNKSYALNNKKIVNVTEICPPPPFSIKTKSIKKP